MPSASRTIGARGVSRLALIVAAAAAIATAVVAPAGAAPAPSYLTYQSHVHLLAGRQGIVAPFTTEGAAVGSPAATSTLTYGGGSVQHNPKVYLIFWGSQWNHDSAGVIPYLTQFFQGTGNGDRWATTMDQYCDRTTRRASTCHSGSVPVSFTKTVYGGTWIDNARPAPSNARANDLAAEAAAAAKHFGNTTSSSNADTQYVVLSPHGTHPDGFPNADFCAWHSATGSPYGTLSFSNDPYMPDGSCGTNLINKGSRGYLDGFSIVGGHEFAESVTDPQPASGWNGQNGEIGDVCSWIRSGSGAMRDITLSTGSFAVQSLWSNADHSCVIGRS